MKKTCAAWLILLSALNVAPAHAHIGKPRHGGAVQSAIDFSFELVGVADGADIYIEDHGRSIAPTGIAGKLTVLNGDSKTEAEIVAARDKLEAKGIKLSKGAKAIALLTLSGKKPITLEFIVP